MLLLMMVSACCLAVTQLARVCQRLCLVLFGVWVGESLESLAFEFIAPEEVQLG
jgi:hypothetical protein